MLLKLSTVLITVVWP